MALLDTAAEPQQADRSDSASGNHPEGSQELSCDIFQSFDGLDGMRGEWDDAVLRAGGSVYMTYDWVRVWWEHYGHDKELRIFMFSAGGRIEAIVPMYIDTLGWGPLRLRVARLVGANIPPKVFDPPVARSHAAEVFAETLLGLFARDDCDVLNLGPVSELQPWIPGFADACQRHADLVMSQPTGRGVYSVFDLPADMDQYYSSLSKNERKNRRKYDLRLLGKEHNTHIEVVSAPELLREEFEHFADQHRRQWFAEGKTGHFGAWPCALDLNRALVDAQGKLGRLRFIRIVADGEVVANQYTFAFGDRYYWELPARAIDPKWDRFSLGPTGIVTMLATGIAEGMNQVEGGLAHYDYKLRLGAREYAALTFRLVATGFASRARFVLFAWARDCIRLAYHKLWYRRIAPRLPSAFWRPQWRLWLRFDF